MHIKLDSSADLIYSYWCIVEEYPPPPLARFFTLKLKGRGVVLTRGKGGYFLLTRHCYKKQYTVTKKNHTNTFFWSGLYRKRQVDA